MLRDAGKDPKRRSRKISAVRSYWRYDFTPGGHNNGDGMLRTRPRDNTIVLAVELTFNDGSFGLIKKALQPWQETPGNLAYEYRPVLQQADVYHVQGRFGELLKLVDRVKEKV